MNDYDYFVLGVGNSNHPANQCECSNYVDVERVKDLIDDLDNLLNRVEVDNEEFHDLFNKLLTWKENN